MIEAKRRGLNSKELEGKLANLKTVLDNQDLKTLERREAHRSGAKNIEALSLASGLTLGTTAAVSEGLDLRSLANADYSDHFWTTINSEQGQAFGASVASALNAIDAGQGAHSLISLLVRKIPAEIYEIARLEEVLRQLERSTFSVRQQRQG